ncbi:hypothetical protein DFQ28_008342 [Apophysomyces sp. BC1034]|nr:hypothetical protein DFQ30_002021 [Apophysomyces sp. BC1015]KAG0186091.1 hypothetical protein DFQ28_008342 [Apophysomyces sp. BC1034]
MSITITISDSPSSGWQQWPGQYDSDASAGTHHHKRAGDGLTSSPSDGQWSNINDLIEQLIQLLQQQLNDDSNQSGTNNGTGSNDPGRQHHVGGVGSHHHCGSTDDGSGASSDQTQNTSSKTPDSTDPSTDKSSESNTSSKDLPAIDGTTTPGKAYTPGKNPKIDQWKDDIDKAAQLTRLDGNLIGGQMWAESRGNPKESSTNVDGTKDLSLMQIGQKRWEKDVLPTLSEQDKANIKKLTGKDPKDLDVSNPHDNVIAGAFELKSHILEHGGDRNNPMANKAALKKGLEDYVGVGDESKYANNVMTNYNVLNKGDELDDSQ